MTIPPTSASVIALDPVVVEVKTRRSVSTSKLAVTPAPAELIFDTTLASESDARSHSIVTPLTVNDPVAVLIAQRLIGATTFERSS